MAKVDIISAVCLLVLVLMTSMALERADAADEDEPDNYFDCRYSETNCKFCCDNYRTDWVANYIKRRLHKNVCQCRSAGGNTSVNLVHKRLRT